MYSTTTCLPFPRSRVFSDRMVKLVGQGAACWMAKSSEVVLVGGRHPFGWALSLVNAVTVGIVWETCVMQAFIGFAHKSTARDARCTASSSRLAGFVSEDCVLGELNRHDPCLGKLFSRDRDVRLERFEMFWASLRGLPMMDVP